jgi:transcriptional regulator with XRE-family HTH domain
MAGKSSKYPNRIKEMIKQTGLTIKEVAEESGIPLRTLSEYCTGNVPVPRKKLEDIALVIGCSSHHLVPALPHLGVDLVQSSYEETDYWISTRGLSKLDLLRRDFLLQMKRFTSLAGISLLTPSDELFNPDAWERLLAVLKKPSHIDAQTLLHLETLTDEYWNLYYCVPVVADLLNSVSSHLVTVVRLLKTNQPSFAEDRLCSIASNTAQILGEIYDNTDKRERAKTCNKLAIRAAKEGKNNLLQAMALAREGFSPVYQGNPHEALSPLHAAYALAEKNATGKTKSWMMMMEAEALASMGGKKKECVDLLNKVEETFYEENTDSEEIPNRDDKKWTGFHQATLARYKGECFLNLHEPVEARSLLLKALENLPLGPTHRHARTAADLASSYIQSQEIEIACDTAIQALGYAAQAKSPGALQHLRKVQQDLHPWQSLACVKRFSNAMRIVEFQ